MPASLERSIRRVPRPAAPLAARGAICSTTTARAIRYRRALPFLPPPLARHHAGANTSPNRTTSRTRSTRRRRASPPTTPRRLPAHRDSSAVYCPHQPTPAPAVLPSTTSIASRVRCACDGRSPSPAPLLSPPRASSASPASTILPDPHACWPGAPSTRQAPSPACAAPAAAAPHRRAAVITSLRAAIVSSASLSSALIQLLSSTGSTTRSKCNEYSPGTAPIFCADASDRSKPCLPRTANRTGTISRAQHTLQLSPHCSIPSPFPTSILSAIPPRSCRPAQYAAWRLPITTAGCVCRDDTAAGEQRTNNKETMRTPRFHRYPPSVLRISDKRGWGTATILGATNPGGDNRTCAPPAFQIAPPPVQFESPASAASSGKGTA